MLDPKRLEFVTRHFRDLQRIRLLPLQLFMALAVVEHRPAVRVRVLLAMACGFLLLVVGFYWWSTVVIRRRYGSVKLSLVEEARMLSHPVIIALFFISGVAPWWLRHVLHSPYGLGSYSDLSVSFAVLIFMLRTILDPTNIRSRRIVYAIGMVVLFAVALIIDVGDGTLTITVAGVVWLSLSVFDFQLLRRAFAEVRV